MSPKDTMGELLNTGFGFFSIIILASYTANLASGFVTQQTLVAPMSSIDEAESRGLPVCVLAGTVAQSMLETAYHKMKIIPVQVLIV